MKFKLLIDPQILQSQYRHTLSKTLLVVNDPAQVNTIKDLLKYAFESFSFALQIGAKEDVQDLCLSTEDGFLLPPNAKVNIALDTNQIIKMYSMKHKIMQKSNTKSEEKPRNSIGLFCVGQSIEKQAEVIKNVESSQKTIIDQNTSVQVKNNRRKENNNNKRGAEMPKKKKVIIVSSPSENGSSSSSEEESSSSSSDESSEDEKVVTKKREIKQVNKEEKKTQKIENQANTKHINGKNPEVDVKSIIQKIHKEFDSAFVQALPTEKLSSEIKVIQPKQQLQIKSPFEINQLKKSNQIQKKPLQKQVQKQEQQLSTETSMIELNQQKQSSVIERPYLNKFDHLLPSQKPTQQFKQIQQKSKDLYDDLFGDSYPSKYVKRAPEVYTKASKDTLKESEAIFSSGGMLEIINLKNRLRILNLDEYLFIDQALMSKINDEIREVIAPKTEVCFKVTEPSVTSGVPQVSEPKIGQIVELQGDQITIQVADDFKLEGEEEELMKEINAEKYQGNGLYKLQLNEIIGLYIKVGKEKRDQLAPKLANLVTNNSEKTVNNSVSKNVISLQQDEQSFTQKESVKNFLANQQESIDKACRRQMEFYFGPTNYQKDKYLQKKAKENPEGWILLKEVMSFNNMRKLTKSFDQVIRSVEGSKIVEISEDKKFVRQRKTQEAEDGQA